MANSPQGNGKRPVIKTSTDQDDVDKTDSSVAILDVQDVNIKSGKEHESPCSSETHSNIDKASPSSQRISNFPDNKRVLVTDPERWGDKDPFVIYTVRTKNADGAVWAVKRRFQEFANLYAGLSDDQDSLVIMPPLPSKANFEMTDKFNPKFIERRRKSLERFLNRLIEHPVLGEMVPVQQFLSQQNFVLRHQPANASTSSIAVVSSSATSSLSTVMEKFGDALAGLGIFSRSNQVEERFEKMKELCKNIESHYAKLEQIFTQIYKAHRAMEEAMMMASKEVNQVQSSMKGLGMIEGDSSDPSLQQMLTSLGVLYEDQANAMKVFADSIKTDLTGPIHEYYKYCVNAKEALKIRDERQFNAEEIAHYLAKSRHQLTELRGGQATFDDPGADNSMLAPLKSGARAVSGYFSDQIDRMKGVDVLTAKQQKLVQLEKRIEALEQAVKSARDAADSADAAIEREMDHFERVLKNELKGNFLPTLVALHKNYLEKSSARWE